MNIILHVDAQDCLNQLFKYLQYYAAFVHKKIF